MIVKPYRPESSVLCFGEALWDCPPAGRFVGGAPLNVAYHLTKLGVRAWPFSSVGDDRLGQELLNRIRDWGVPIDLIGVAVGKPPGVVNVTVVVGSPSYDIATDVAWDHIAVPGELPADVEPIGAVVFGSLAQRGRHNRDSLQQLLAIAASALKVFDVNLRPPFVSLARVWRLAGQADLIKLNDEEAGVLLNLRQRSPAPEQIARELSRRSQCARVCLTCGSAGAGYLDAGDWYWSDSESVEVADTIGAGDSFLAALLHGLLTAPDRPDRALKTAARLAGFVAANAGATPDYERSMLVS